MTSMALFAVPTSRVFSSPALDDLRLRDARHLHCRVDPDSPARREFESFWFWKKAFRLHAPDRVLRHAEQLRNVTHQPEPLSAHQVEAPAKWVRVKAEDVSRKAKRAMPRKNQQLRSAAALTKASIATVHTLGPLRHCLNTRELHFNDFL